MAVPSRSIAHPVPIVAPLGWRDQVADMLEQVKREARTELWSTHPGSRHRVSYLLAVGANLSAQLADLDAREVGR